MIAKFPNFTNLGIEHKSEIEKLISPYQPYSDFNFTSLFCYDTDNSTQVSVLNDNLVIKMADYISGEVFYSILGNHAIDRSLDTLLDKSTVLKLVPEVVVDNIERASLFDIVEDRDQFDYVYPLSGHADLPGGHYKVKRNKISKFMRVYGEQLRLKRIHFDDIEMKQEIRAIFWRWAKERQRADEDVQREAKTLDKLFDFGRHFNLIGIRVFLGDECVGFSINEMVQMDYAICHFQKSILSFEHIDVFLSNLVAKELRHFGCRYINWEQDLGLPGLRKLKESYVQEFFLRKYTVCRRN